MKLARISLTATAVIAFATAAAAQQKNLRVGLSEDPEIGRAHV